MLWGVCGLNEDCFYYDIKSGVFINWADMTGNQKEPSLIQINDFVYAFHSFSKQGFYFERTSITAKPPKWEKIVPQSGDKESGYFYNQLFGVSKCSTGKILITGGKNCQFRSFLYDIKSNILSITNGKDEEISLVDKLFYKIDHNFSIAVPQNFEKNNIIALLEGIKRGAECGRHGGGHLRIL